MPTTVLGWVVGMGPLGIVSAVIYAILRGHLVPRSTFNAFREDKEKQVAELGSIVDLWRSAALAKDAAITEFIPMLTEITENDKLILKLLGAIREVVDKPAEETP